MKKTLLSGVVLALALASTAQAQTPAQDMGPVMAQMHGGLEELARQCNLHTAAELTTMKTKNQQKLAADNQLSAVQFERHHAQGATEVKARFAPLTPSQKAQACDEARQHQNIRPVSR